jgi:catechol 2,3-dioxygenase-like lactoylglutathione lyase family enzyme
MQQRATATSRSFKPMEPRLSLVTLGVHNLARAVAFYRDGLGLPTDTSSEGVAFIDMGGVKLSLFPLEELAKDAKLPPQEDAPSQPFPGFSLAHNVRTREEVAPVIATALAAGATLVKAAEDAFWGGHCGYFRDPDGYLWEVAWNPHWTID